MIDEDAVENMCDDLKTQIMAMFDNGNDNQQSYDEATKIMRSLSIIIGDFL